MGRNLLCLEPAGAPAEIDPRRRVDPTEDVHNVARHGPGVDIGAPLSQQPLDWQDAEVEGDILCAGERVWRSRAND